MKSEDILIRISHLKDEVESKTKEIESLHKQLRKNAEREARRLKWKMKRRAERMADFIKHNSSRTIVVKCTVSEFNSEEYLGEKNKEFICKPGEYKLFKSCADDWAIEKPNEFSMLLEYADNIYVRFE